MKKGIFMTTTTFSTLQPFLQKGVEGIGFRQPTEIQEKIIPSVLKGETIVGQSQTGTGKTHAYLLPILNKIDPHRTDVQAVITTPTRELANQVYKEIVRLTNYCPEDAKITARCFVGGTDKQRAIDKLKIQPHIVVGTPGRLNDLVKAQALFVHKATVLVVDEADLAFDMGFISEIDNVAGKMPDNLQMLVFSATIPEKLKPFLKKYMENPIYTHVQSKNVAADNVEHVLVPRRQRSKMQVLYELLIKCNPYLAIVFTNTKKMADIVARELGEKGLKVGVIHGDLTPRERTKAMKQIRDLEFQYIVATDLAARGIDIVGVSHVINYEIPKELEFYIHRVGRTARAGTSGTAITMYEPEDEDKLQQLIKLGISFIHRDLTSDGFVDLKEWDRRTVRKKPMTIMQEADKKVNHGKPKQVKPGYKKKFQQKVKDEARKIRRSKKEEK